MSYHDRSDNFSKGVFADMPFREYSLQPVYVPRAGSEHIFQNAETTNGGCTQTLLSDDESFDKTIKTKTIKLSNTQKKMLIGLKRHYQTVTRLPLPSAAERCYHGLTANEISKATGVSIGTVCASLESLRKRGFVNSTFKKIAGKPRRSFLMSDTGIKAIP